MYVNEICIETIVVVVINFIIFVGANQIQKITILDTGLIKG